MSENGVASYENLELLKSGGFNCSKQPISSPMWVWKLFCFLGELDQDLYRAHEN